MTNYSRGAAAERKARKMLEADGYYVIRSAGSHGLWDLTCYSTTGKRPAWRLIQVKYRTKISQAEMRAILDAPVPRGTQKEIWRFLPRVGEPEVLVPDSGLIGGRNAPQ